MFSYRSTCFSSSNNFAAFCTFRGFGFFESGGGMESSYSKSVDTCQNIEQG